MHYRRLGRSGLKVSEISFGSWVTLGRQIDEKVASALLHAAYEQGVNSFDNADVYAGGKAEEVMGKAIADLPREELVLSSKVFWPTSPGPNGRGLSRKHIMESLHKSLKKMGTDYFDLYYCHRFDPDTPIDEVVQTMDIIIRQGKVMYWGTSEWTAAQIALAHGVARENGWTPPAVEQPQYNMFIREHLEVDLAPLCKELGLGLTTWSPLYNGILSGKYNEEIPEGSRATMKDLAWVRDLVTPDRINRVRELTDIAADLGGTTAQLALAWCLRRKDISSVIIGATRPEQLDENLAASDLTDKLTDEILSKIDQIMGNAP
jgi:voltage-dependent potassium channel beta subunit